MGRVFTRDVDGSSEVSIRACLTMLLLPGQRCSDLESSSSSSSSSSTCFSASSSHSTSKPWCNVLRKFNQPIAVSETRGALLLLVKRQVTCSCPRVVPARRDYVLLLSQFGHLACFIGILLSQLCRPKELCCALFRYDILVYFVLSSKIQKAWWLPVLVNLGLRIQKTSRK